jgi:hypothetical protein
VVFRVMLAGFARVVGRMSVVAGGRVGVMGGRLMIARVVMLGGVTMVLGGVLVMLGRFQVVFAGGVGHLGLLEGAGPPAPIAEYGLQRGRSSSASVSP